MFFGIINRGANASAGVDGDSGGKLTRAGSSGGDLAYFSGASRIGATAFGAGNGTCGNDSNSGTRRDSGGGGSGGRSAPAASTTAVVKNTFHMSSAELQRYVVSACEAEAALSERIPRYEAGVTRNAGRDEAVAAVARAKLADARRQLAVAVASRKKAEGALAGRRHRALLEAGKQNSYF
ncbi:unnamed protein product [Phaeothamnion confervicola]